MRVPSECTQIFAGKGNESRKRAIDRVIEPGCTPGSSRKVTAFARVSAPEIMQGVTLRVALRTRAARGKRKAYGLNISRIERKARKVVAHS